VSDEGPFVQSLRDAGCVLLGKSLSTEFAFGQFNLGRPMPVNPAVTSEDRVTGGSSSGSAGAMAAGYCGFAIGTDTGGSVRAPAAFTGVVGFKPTQGLWSAQGVFPLARGLDTPGLFTRSVGDAASIFTALTGQHLDGLAVPGQLRIGVAPAYFTAGLDGVVADAWHKTLGTLAAAGHELVPLTLAGLPVVEDFYATEVPLELLQTLGAEQLFAQQGLLDPLTLSRLAAVRDNVSDRELLGLIDRLVVDCQAELSAAQLDCWLAPTVPVVAPMHAELAEIEALQQWQALASRNTRVINILKLPALSLPLQASLPVGLQVVAAEGADAMLLAIAGELEVLLAAD
jgi:aspartyl-tRNA(Asn)/glutamyl-tRNA(Gln) amidotransferase subunit A